MSPQHLRRFRAERLLRREFRALRGRVLASARRRLSARGVALDPADLEACYAQAWQGLYAAVLEGHPIEDPAAWLALVTFRRAIDEHRAQRRLERLREQRAFAGGGADGDDGELAARLDDRLRLSQMWEGLCGRLGSREREAAVLCYLQGLSRADAAARMGISESRMRKLREGRGGGALGVARKVGELAETISGGGWCEEQGSLMRALAFGILDPAGERYRLALMHHGQCPACRAYVVSLRGLAAALPPVLLPGSLGAGLLELARGGARGAARGGAGPAGGSAAQLARGAGGALSASGASAAGGGGWLLGGGPLGAKLAAGCLLAISVGAGCLSLERGARPPARAPVHRAARAARAGTQPLLAAGLSSAGGRGAVATGGGSAPVSGAGEARGGGSAAEREFSPG